MTANAYPTPESEGVVLAQSFPLDAGLYSLEGEELRFMRSQTMISDDEELKDHIMRVQAEAYSVGRVYRVSRGQTALSYSPSWGLDLPISVYSPLWFHTVRGSASSTQPGVRGLMGITASSSSACRATTACFPWGGSMRTGSY
ncbi:hypothetical protein C8Q73DRAFT_109740 [Cubamyces lactineus]|nr:hypothetical protein C8Q73DRAFT_109740 [Cubamyces lactineus]